MFTRPYGQKEVRDVIIRRDSVAETLVTTRSQDDEDEDDEGEGEGEDELE